MCGTFCVSRRFKSSGIASCFWIRSKSVVPPIPSEVSSAREVAGLSCTPRPRSAATILGSSMRMVGGMLGPQENHQFIARPADITRADGHNRVARPCLMQQKFNACLHRPEVMHIFVPRAANRIGERLAGDTGDGNFACGVNVQQHQDVGLIKSPTKFIPKVLRAGIAVGLEKHQEAIELAAAGGFERGPYLRGMMTVIVYDCDVVHDAFDIEAPAY